MNQLQCTIEFVLSTIARSSEAYSTRGEVVVVHDGSGESFDDLKGMSGGGWL